MHQITVMSFSSKADKAKIKQILNYADISRKDGTYTDVCIKAGEESFPAHRLILSCYSLYFRAMFQAATEEKYANIVELKGVDETSLGLLINFIYTGKITINKKNVFDLLAASDYLQVDEVKQFCFDHLHFCVSAENCFEILEIADLYKNSKLLSKTSKCISDNFEKLLSSKGLKSLSKSSLLSLLSELNPNCIDWCLVYCAIIGWVKHKDSRKDNLAEIFQCLDVNELPSQFLAEKVSTEALVVENQFCQNLVLQTLDKQVHDRASSFLLSKILSLGGLKTPNDVFVVYNNDRKDFPALPQNAFCSLKCDNFVYCIGGKIDGTSSDKVWRMNINEISMGWQKVASMKTNVSDFAAASHKNAIAVVGGCLQSAVKSAAIYNPSLNQWSALPSMNQSRHGHALVAFHDYLFCLGGLDHKDGHLKSVEKLCKENQTWLPAQPMQKSRCQFAAVNCMNSIYAIGGRDLCYLPMKSVEKLKVRSKNWIFVAPMTIERYGHSACVMQEKIFVVGGKNVKSKFVSEIECYDPLKNKWLIVGHTKKNLIGHSIVPI